MKSIVLVLVSVWISLFFTACGSSSPTTTVQPLQKGYVVDSPIAGLDYECGDIIGLTNNEGMFECRTFPITFKIGNLTIGTVAREAAMQHLKDNVEKLTSIMITPTTTTIELGKTAIFKAEGSFSNGAKRDISSEVTWSSSDITKATVATNGVGCVMNSIAPLIIPVGFVLAGIIAYIAHKRNWKIADFF